MNMQELIQSINYAYQIIDTRTTSVKNGFDEKGISWTRITFEDISLEDILDDVLIPILPELIDNYEYLPKAVLWKSYKVYIAAFCEISKGGLDGGILKTVRGRIGEFSISRHYRLIKQALEFERIPIIDKAKKYEETIIYEAGIPRGFRRKCLAFFTTYWKWLNNYDREKRYAFLNDFLNDVPINEVYIFDSNDYSRLVNLKNEFSSFSEKVIKTCEKLDRVFSAIDQYPEEITEDNLTEVSSKISKELGFDILTVIRTDAIKQYILEYSKKISFAKLEHILDVLPSTELIGLPNRRTKRKDTYSFDSYMGGKHLIRGNAYEVSFPIHLDINDLYALERNTPILIGNSVIYTSLDDIFIEKDGRIKPFRVFYNSEQGYLNVYYDRVTPASFIYIDGQLLPNEEPFSKRVFIGKYWDHEVYHYKLAVIISELKFADRSLQMQPARFLCNNETIYSSSVNRNGSFVIRDIVRPLSNNVGDCLTFDFRVGNSSICCWNLDVRNIYIWGKQSGLRVDEELDISKWIGNNELIIFSKTAIACSNCCIDFLYDECGYHVYKGLFDKTAESLQIDELCIPITEPKTAYLKLKSEFNVISEKICIESASTFGIDIVNYSEELDCILRIEHDSRSVSYNVRNLETRNIDDVISLFPRRGITQFDVVGQWNISLISRTKCVSTISVVILPELFIQMSKDVYACGESVEAVVTASSNCFEVEGVYTNKMRVSVGKAILEYENGNFTSKIIETDVFIDKCEVSKQVNIKPNVWDLVYVDSQKKVNSINSGSTINHKELEKGLYVITPQTTQMDIRVNDDAFYARLIPGRNIIKLKNLLKNAVLKNRVVFSLDGGKKDFFILFNPNVSCVQHKIEGKTVLFSFDYFGPVNTEVILRFYSGDEIICNNKKTMDSNISSFDVMIDKKEFKSNTVAIEIKIGRQDFRRLFEGNIDLIKREKLRNGLFNANSSILDLLEWTGSEQGSVDHSSIISMLEAGGEI